MQNVTVTATFREAMTPSQRNSVRWQERLVPYGENACGKPYAGAKTLARELVRLTNKH